MLSHHEISTLLLVQRAPQTFDAYGADLLNLQKQKLVEVERLRNGHTTAHLTRRGQEVLRRLEHLHAQRPTELDRSVA